MEPPITRARGAMRSPRRGREACHSCHSRKVRCDVELTGLPCTNCALDAVECVRRSRKPYTTRTARRHTVPYNGSKVPSTDSGTPLSSKASRRKVSSLQRSYPVSTGALSETEATTPIEVRDDSTQALGRSTEDGKVFATAVIDGGSTDGESPIFIGDRQGFGYILDAMNIDGPAKPQHYLIPRKTASLLASEDLIYLKSKGCFSLPAKALCESLLECYFQHVHPTLPIIDMGTFLTSFVSKGVEGSNLLLLWSMFSVAGSFLPYEAVSSGGFASRKELKYSMYRRAKCLYESGGEEDMIVLIQSAILLGFWYSPTEGRTGSWHWTGQAIGLAQTIGLHRNIDARQRNTALPDHRRRLWRRIWWACFYRDRWLSLYMGRPMRICADDCDVPMLTVSEVTDDLKNLAVGELEPYVPRDIAELCRYCICFIKLSVVLGDILAKNYRPHAPVLTASEVLELEQNVMEAIQDCDDIIPRSLLSKNLSESLQIQKHATIITLYRPFLPKNQQNGREYNESTISPSIVRQKISEAAMSTNVILDRIVAADMVKILGPMIPPNLVPAMHSHLLDSKSTNSLTRSLGLHRLDLYLLVLEEVEQNYPAASVIRMLFLQAKENKKPKTLVQPEPPVPEQNHNLPTPVGMIDADLNGHDLSTMTPIDYNFFAHGFEGSGDIFTDALYNHVLDFWDYNPQDHAEGDKG